MDQINTNQPIQPTPSIKPAQPAEQTNYLVYSLFAVLVAGAIGLFAGWYFLGAGKGLNAGGACQSTLKEVFSGVLSVNNLSGKITAVSSDKKSLTILVSGIYGVNLPKSYQEKKVLIDGNTKIVLRTNKTAEVFQKELTELKNRGINTPPLPYVEQEINVNDLKIGDAVSFTFLPNENTNILSSQFTAVQINANR